MMSTKALDQIVLLIAYLPTLFAIISLGTASERYGDSEFKDKKGIVGGISGVSTLCYAIFYCFGISSRTPDICKVLMVTRLSLGIFFVIGGAFLSLKSDVPKAVVMFCYAALALPEAYLLFVYGDALAKAADGGHTSEQQMASLGPPSGQDQGPPFHSQPSYGGPPPSAGGFGGGYQQDGPPGGFGPGGYRQDGPPGGYGQGGYGGGPPPSGDGFGLGAATGQSPGGFGAPPPQPNWAYH